MRRPFAVAPRRAAVDAVDVTQIDGLRVFGLLETSTTAEPRSLATKRSWAHALTGTREGHLTARPQPVQRWTRLRARSICLRSCRSSRKSFDASSVSAPCGWPSAARGRCVVHQRVRWCVWLTPGVCGDVVPARALQARVAVLEGEKRVLENSQNDLNRRILMLQYALRQERFVVCLTGCGWVRGTPPAIIECSCALARTLIQVPCSPFLSFFFLPGWLLAPGPSK